MVLDAKRAFHHGETKRSIYIRFPKEDPIHGEPGLLAKLQEAMYGTRDAPQVWQREVKRTMNE